MEQLHADTTRFRERRSTQSRDTFVEKTGLSLANLRGKTILDVGCGMGRFTEVVAGAGARVVGIDLSSAVDAAAPNLERFENAAVVQADVFSLPFGPETFDLIYSIGVLHHTPDTREAFRALPGTAKRGQVAVWLYARMLRWHARDEPCLSARDDAPAQGPSPEAVPDRGSARRVQRSGRIGTLVQFLFPVSNHPHPEWRILDTFDWYSPRYQWTHTDAEVEGWFREAKLENIWHGSFPVSVRGVKV